MSNYFFMQAKRGFVQILPLILLGVFAVTTVIITNSAKKQPGPTARVVTQATGGCTFNGSFFEPGLHCVQNWAYWCYDNGNFERGDHSCGAGPAPTTASCGNWNVSCNNGEGFSTTDCVVIRDYFGGDENRWKTEACQNRCGVIGTANTCGQGGPPAGGQGGGPSSDEKAKTCETGGPTASACYGVTVGNRCTGFNGTCINNGGLNSDGYAVCGCRADAAPTQRPQATATTRPAEAYCHPAVFADCQAVGLRCLPDRDGGTCETVPTRISTSTRVPPTATRQPTVRPQATATPTTMRDDYYFRQPSATRVPLPGERCGNTYRGRCVGQGLVCDRTHFGQIDCPSGNNCVPESAVCRTPAAPTSTPRPTSTTQPTLASRPASPTACAVGLCYPNGCPSSVPYRTSSTCTFTLRDGLTSQLKPGICCTSNASLGVDTRSPTRTPFPTVPPGYLITTPDVGRPSPTVAPQPTIDAEDYRTSLRLPTTYQPTNVVPLEYGDICYAPNDPPIPELTSCLGCPNGGRYTRLDTTNNPIGTSRCAGQPQPTTASLAASPTPVRIYSNAATTISCFASYLACLIQSIATRSQCNMTCGQPSAPSSQPTYQIPSPTPTIYCQPTPTPNPNALLTIGTACYISGTSIDDCEKCPYSGVAITPLDAQNTRVCSLPRQICR